MIRIILNLMQFVFCLIFYVVSVISCYPTIYSQKSALSKEEPNNFSVTGKILNYSDQYLYFYKCYGDSLIFLDSIKTDSKGNFAVVISNLKSPIQDLKSSTGIYLFNLPRNQFFYILSEKDDVKIKTEYSPNIFYNNATDNLVVLKGKENKLFYKFLHLQNKLNIANFWLMKIMRLYPLEDPFHEKVVKEYFKRHKKMNHLVAILLKRNRNTAAAKVALAYYQPVNPDWKQPDPWRDSLIARQYFDYFDPSDKFYLHTNILPEKMNIYLSLMTNKRDHYGQPIYDEMLYADAANEFLTKTLLTRPDFGYKERTENFDFCLDYFLKLFDKEKKYDALFSVYNSWVVAQAEEECEPTDKKYNRWREKVSILRNIQIGNMAPDFAVVPEALNLHQIPAENILLVFWASWCFHCLDELPKIKSVLEKNMDKSLFVIFISLDTDENSWHDAVSRLGLQTYLHLCDFKRWQGEVVKKYNIYATPTMFLLDKEKVIIGKPKNAIELRNTLQSN